MKFTNATLVTLATFLTMEPLVTHHGPELHSHQETENPLQYVPGINVYGDIQFNRMRQYESTYCRLVTIANSQEK